MLMWEFGLREYWSRPYYQKYEKCIVKAEKTKKKPLSLEDFYSVFVLLGMGEGLALVLFVYQILRAKMLKHLHAEKIAAAAAAKTQIAMSTSNQSRRGISEIDSEIQEVKPPPSVKPSLRKRWANLSKTAPF